MECGGRARHERQHRIRESISPVASTSTPMDPPAKPTAAPHPFRERDLRATCVAGTSPKKRPRERAALVNRGVRTN